MGTIQFPSQRIGQADGGAPPVAATSAPEPKPSAPANPAAELIAAQNEARKLYPRNPQTRQSHCNQATCFIARQMKAPLRPLEDAQGYPYLANRIAQNLAESTKWRDVSPEEAQTIGNKGRLAVGAWYNPAGHGHVVTVRPEGVPGDAPVGRSGPLLNDIGEEDRVAHQSLAFKPGDQVHCYTPWEKPGGRP